MKRPVWKVTSSKNQETEKPVKTEEHIFSLEEYNSLRNETVERISIMNNQASSAFGLLLTTWGAGFTLLGILVSYQTSGKSNEIPFLLLLLLSVGQVFAFLSSLLMLVPMAIKSGENLRQLISLGVYIRVFYDYVSKYRECKQRFSWDTADKQVSAFTTTKGTDKFWLRQYNAEYIVLGFISTTFLSISYVYNTILLQPQIPTNYLLAGGLLIAIFAFYLLHIIHTKSSTKRNLMLLSDEYTKKYLVLAVESGFIEKKDLTNAWNELDPGKAIELKEYSRYFDKQAP